MNQSATQQSTASLLRFDSGLSHLQAELERLDLYIARRVAMFRYEHADIAQRVAASPAYVSDEEIDWLLQIQHNFAARDFAPLDALEQKITALEQAIAVALDDAESRDIDLPLLRLARMFDLSELDYQLLLLCLAPELRRKYDRIYAYLQDDITRKRPSLDLFLDLFIDQENLRWQARAQLDQQSPLFRHRLLTSLDDSQSPSGSTALARLLQVDTRVLQYLMGNPALDERLTGIARLVTPDQTDVPDQAQLSQIMQWIEAGLASARDQRLLLHMSGAERGGQLELALAICRTLGIRLLVADGRALNLHHENSLQVLLYLARESLLQQAPLLIENIDEFLTDDVQGRHGLQRLASTLEEYCGLSFCSAGKPWPSLAAPEVATLLNVAVALPDAQAQGAIWAHALTRQGLPSLAQEDANITQQFRLNAWQIEQASKQLHIRTRGGQRRMERMDIAAVCRDVSQHGLSELAIRVPAHYRWSDLVLPDEPKATLKSICAQARRRAQVMEHWGFAEKLPYGRGLGVMFTGTPGTGKTMAAQVMANDLQLELFKIDLSGVVSKYIGETEKNLNRVFGEAQASNAILFFDEADALFGKRTDVSDAHDRYANIEVSYLLQKMEEYDGIVIMATNLRNNIDEAFLRRLRFIVEFPFPDADSRQQIWRGCVPAATPLRDDVDFHWLAQRIKVSGGNIKNIVLNAAFEAADSESAIGMQHILCGCRREFQKIGKTWDEAGMQLPDLNDGAS